MAVSLRPALHLLLVGVSSLSLQPVEEVPADGLATPTADGPAIPTRATWQQLDDPGKTALFLKLAPSLGIHCPKLGVDYFPLPSGGGTVRGAISLQPIEAMEEVCVIDVKALVTKFTIGNSTLKPLMDARPSSDAGSHNYRALVTTYLLREGARDSSPHMPYVLGTLAQHEVDWSPAVWSHEKIASSLNKLGQARALAGQQYVQSEYERIFGKSASTLPPNLQLALSDGLCPQAQETANGAVACPAARLDEIYSLSNFRTMYAALRGRDWVTTLYDAFEYTSVAIPFLDLLNYGEDGLVLEFDPARHAMVATATQPIASGVQVHYFYGSHCKEDMVEMYGFALPDMPPCEGWHLGDPYKGDGSLQGGAAEVTDEAYARQLQYLMAADPSNQEARSLVQQMQTSGREEMRRLRLEQKVKLLVEMVRNESGRRNADDGEWSEKKIVDAAKAVASSAWWFA